MTEMIDDLLQYAGGQLGRKIPIYPEAEDMETVCRIVLEEVRMAHPNVIFNFEKSGDLKGSFDSARFQQVLSNLLNNAANHGGHEMPVTLSALGDSDETITVRVKNFNRPIPPESLQVIFDPLVQVTSSEPNSDSHRSTSLGLGLFIAKDIVEGHNGTIEVSSSEAEGTVFTVQIPRNN